MRMWLATGRLGRGKLGTCLGLITSPLSVAAGRCRDLMVTVDALGWRREDASHPEWRSEQYEQAGSTRFG